MTRRFVIWIALVLGFVSMVAVAAGTDTATTTGFAAPLTKNGVAYDGRVLQRGKSDKVVAVIPVVGTIQGGDSPSGGSATGSEDFVRLLDAIGSASKRFDGVILELNTPGGSVLAAQEMHDAILRLKRDHKLKVVSWMRDTAASAGYFIAAPTDHIIAASTTFTGSIGVILQYVEVSELADEVGVKPVTIKSAAMKDIASPFKPITAAERELLQTVIDEAYDEFVGVVADGRDMDQARVRKLADGRIYTGRQAQSNGLIDSIGLRADAYEAMAKQLNVSSGEDLKVVRYGRRYSWVEALSAAAPKFAPTTALAQAERLLDKGNGFMTLEYRAELG